MRIFKRKFSEELTRGMSVGECIITKIDDTSYGEFAVYRKESNEAFPYLGCFPLLQEAIKYVKSVEEQEPEIKYEYYLQSQKELREGWNREQLESMGKLGWELCGIQSNITDDEGRAMFIYKRRIPSENSMSKHSYIIAAEDGIEFINSNPEITFPIIDLRNINRFSEIEPYLYNHIIIVPINEDVLKYLDFESIAYTEVYMKDSDLYKENKIYNKCHYMNAVWTMYESKFDIGSKLDSLQKRNEYISGFNLGARAQNKWIKENE